MTVSELLSSEKVFLTCAEVAPIFNANPATLRMQARLAPERLGFPVSCHGTRVLIPRLPLLRFLGLINQEAAPEVATFEDGNNTVSSAVVTLPQESEFVHDR